MLKRISIVTLFLQATATFLLLYFLYVWLGPANDMEAEMMNAAVYLILVPVILIGGSITVCFLAGLPLRLIGKWEAWWLQRQIIPLIGILAGVLILISRLNEELIGSTMVLIVNPEGAGDLSYDPTVVFAWFLTTFSVLHFYPGKLFRKAQA